MKKERKLDIFDVMAAVDKRDVGYLSRQPADVQKGFAPPVVLRWASAVKGPEAENYIWLVNDIANVDYHSLYEHPELQFKLIALCGAGKPQRHEWIPIAKSAKSSSKVHAFLANFHPLANHREIDMLIGQHTLETFTDFVYSSGADPEQAKELLDAFKKQSKA